jgi:hypothetical protein
MQNYLQEICTKIQHISTPKSHAGMNAQNPILVKNKLFFFTEVVSVTFLKST